jgi:hypothetical protein
MPRYARATEVPVERSRAEIEQTLRRYKASEFHSGWKANAAMIAFRLGQLFIRFVLPLPAPGEKRFTHKKGRYGYEVKRSDPQAHKEWDQEVRQRWRALLLVIKAKLEAVDCGISTVEAEFLANIVMPNDLTLGDWIIEGALPAIRAGAMPHLALPAPPRHGAIADAEFEERKP